MRGAWKMLKRRLIQETAEKDGLRRIGMCNKLRRHGWRSGHFNFKQGKLQHW